MKRFKVPMRFTSSRFSVKSATVRERPEFIRPELFFHGMWWKESRRVSAGAASGLPDVCI